MAPRPVEIFQNREPSVSSCIFLEDQSAGFGLSAAAAAPSPLPLAPWHEAQFTFATFSPCSTAFFPAATGFFLPFSASGAAQGVWAQAPVLVASPMTRTRATTPNITHLLIDFLPEFEPAARVTGFTTAAIRHRHRFRGQALSAVAGRASPPLAFVEAARETLLAAFLVDKHGLAALPAQIADLPQGRAPGGGRPASLPGPVADMPAQDPRERVGKGEHLGSAEARGLAAADAGELADDLLQPAPRRQRRRQPQDERDQPSQGLGHRHGVGPRLAHLNEHLEGLA